MPMAANNKSDHLIDVLKQLQERKTVKPEEATKALTQYLKVKEQVQSLRKEIEIFKTNRSKQTPSPKNTPNDVKDQNKKLPNQNSKDAVRNARPAPSSTTSSPAKTSQSETKQPNGPVTNQRRASEPAAAGAAGNQRQQSTIKAGSQPNGTRPINGAKPGNGARRTSLAVSPVRDMKGSTSSLPKSPRKDEDPLQAKLTQQTKDIGEKDQEIARLRFQNAQLKVTVENRGLAGLQNNQPSDSKSVTSAPEKVNFPPPQKLVVDFKVIYENEWKSAFHDLDKHYKLSEEAITDLLAAVAREAYNFCTNVAKQQLDDITKNHAHVIDVLVQPRYVTLSTKDVHTPKSKAIIDKDGYSTTRKFLRQYRRAMARVPIAGITELFESVVQKDVLSRHSSLKITPKSLRPYIHKLVEVDWLMSISEPPLFQLWPRGGQLMSRELFAAYDKKGATIIHCVWPAVLMYKDGPCADKGVCLVK